MRRLAQAEPATYDYGLARGLSRLGAVLQSQGELAQAREKHEGALAILRRLAQAEPAAYERDLARSLSNLGNVLQCQGELTWAQEKHEEALAIRRRLVRAEPVAYEPDLADSLNLLGIVLYDLGEASTAHDLFSEAVATAQRSAGVASRAYDEPLALYLANLARACVAANRRGEALAYAEQAVGLYRRETGGQSALPTHLAFALGVLASALGAAGRGDDALGTFDESLSLFIESATATPALYLRYLDEVALNAQHFLARGVDLSSWGTLQRALRTIDELMGADAELARQVRDLRAMRPALPGV